MNILNIISIVVPWEIHFLMVISPINHSEIGLLIIKWIYLS